MLMLLRTCWLSHLIFGVLVLLAILLSPVRGEEGSWELAAAMENAWRDGSTNDAAFEPILRFYKAQAGKGDARELFRLGLCYRGGRGVRRDMPQAARLLIKAAARGDRKMLLTACDVACEEAALRTIPSDSVTPLVEPLKKLRDAGDPAATARYAGFLLHDRAGVRKAPAHAVSLARAAAAKGDPRGKWRLGNSLLLGRGVKIDAAAAMDLLKQAAGEGESQAMVDLGRILLNSDGSEALKAEGLAYAKQAAAADNPWGAYLLADCCYRGNGVSRDVDKAIRWYRRSAERGYARAMHLLGVRLTLEGKSASVQVKAEGFRWLLRAPEI